LVAALNIHSEKSRIRALLLNSGRYSAEEAELKLASMRLRVHLGEDASATPAGQAAALTAIVTAIRCFDQVYFEGALEAPLLLPLPIPGKTIGSVAAKLGALTTFVDQPLRSVLIGSGGERGLGQEVRATWNGWNAGVAPANLPVAAGRGDCALAGIAAGAQAVGQCFLAEQGDPYAGRRRAEISLWTPDAKASWDNPGPLMADVYLPTALWLVGLGNLGQAFIWSITCLPYATPRDLLLFLQDDDAVSEENWGTSILVERGRYGDLKTLVGERWCLSRGFRVRRIDRRLDESLKRADLEPSIALAGLDRIEPRKLLGLPGFAHVIDAGLGAEAGDFHQLRVNVFGKDRSPADHFTETEEEIKQRAKRAGDREATLRSLDVYQEHERTNPNGACGTAELLGISVAVPFVGVFAGALAVSQAVRIASNLAPHATICGSLADVNEIKAVLGPTPGRAMTGSVKAGTFGSAPHAP
jgi:hypothetical protein